MKKYFYIDNETHLALEEQIRKELAEKRFADLHISCEWFTQTEIKFKELNKDVMFHLNLLKSMMNKKIKKCSILSKRAPNQMERDTVLRLKSNNWTVEEICNGLNMTRGEVELLLELASKEYQKLGVLSEPSS